MFTRGLDIVTIMHALCVLERELNLTPWSSKNEQQRKFFGWFDQHREVIAKITGLDAKASNFWEELNKFLTERGFDPLVKPFDPKLGIGVVSILDKLVNWLNGPGELVEISTSAGDRPGFEIPPTGVNVFEVKGYPNSNLLQLHTKSDDTLWLFDHPDTTLDGLNMVELALKVMAAHREIQMTEAFYSGGHYQSFAGAQIPMTDFDIKPDLNWLVGADTETASGDYYYIGQAAQQFKFRMDQHGARVKVATVVVTMRGISEGPQVYQQRRPFYGWFTQKGVDLPMAVFFADWDALHQPAGSLEDL